MSRSLAVPARARAHLSLSDVSVSFGGSPVLASVDLHVSPGERLGVVGENGRGKTTLLRVLSGVLVPGSGMVSLVGTVGVVDQEMAGDGTVGDVIDTELAHARAALRDLEAATEALVAGDPKADAGYARALEVAEALDAWDADRRVDVSLAALGAVGDRTRALSSLSVGQRYRVRLACLLGAGHDILLLDEPTNHLDAAGLDHLTARLRAHPGCVVLVSHDRALLADVATSVLDVDPSRDGRPRLYGGGYAGYRDGRHAERERWEADYRAQLAEHDRLAGDLAAAQNRLSSGWRPEKGHGKHTRATRAPGLVRAVHRRQEDLEAHVVDVPEPPLRLSVPELPAAPGVLLRADDASVEGRLAAVSVSVSAGDRLMVTGPNGAGKSTLLHVLAGRLAPDGGSVRRSRRVALLAQESAPPSRRLASLVYADAVQALVTAGALGQDDVVALSGLGLLSPRDQGRPVAELSVGQQRRLDLAILLASRPHAVLLDEPTNHLSATLVDELTEALSATAAAVVVATHDRQLLRDTERWDVLAL